MLEKIKSQSLKPFGWGFVIGALLLLIGIFASGWVVTSSEAKEKAEEQATEAVNQRLSQYCLHQFKQTANIEKHMKKLQEMDSWDRADYVAEHGWATIPGSDSSNTEVADICTEKIMQLNKKQGE